MLELRICTGDALHWLKQMASDSIHCVITSPPYFGLRDYGAEGQIGLEPTFESYLEKLTAVFDEARRVLRSDGTLFLNVGDSYATGTNGARLPTQTGKHGYWENPNIKHRINGANMGLKPKDMIGIPWRLAFALQSAGWYLRQDIIWAKPNPMPESVRDRCTKSHEYLFLLSKSERYYFDAKSIEEPLAAASAERYAYAFGGAKSNALIEANKTGVGQRTRVSGERDTPTGRNKRSVWTITPEPFKEAHFATFPTKLVEPCMLAGSPRGGIVLDPFGGSGTVAVVAKRLERHCVLIEINPTYAEMARNRHDNS